MEPEYIYIAEKMLHSKAIPAALRAKLDRINALIMKVLEDTEYGGLRSRQVIALVVSQYIDDMSAISEKGE